MPALSILNLDARYSVSQELVLVFISSWAARYNDDLLGFFPTRREAEGYCFWHESVQMCDEELVVA